MPIPKPEKDETKNQYTSRVISFLVEENKSRDKPWTTQQMVAIAYSLWEKKDSKITNTIVIDENVYMVEQIHDVPRECLEQLKCEDSIKDESFGDDSFDDDCFMYVPEEAKGSEGKKSTRKLPYRNKDGTMNLNHVYSALKLLPKAEGIPEEERIRIRDRLRAILKKINPDYIPKD
jgi:hypothetical protein